MSQFPASAAGAASAVTAAPGTPTLRRVVTRWELVALSLNDVIGSGVYLLPAAAAALLGPASVWAVLLAGLAVLFIVLCFAEAASHFDRPGSGYLYTRAAFGDFIGFEVGWMTVLARVTSVAALSNGFAQALAYLWPAAAAGTPRAGVISALILAFVWLNVIGVKYGARAAVVLSVAKILPLIFLAAVGLVAIDPARLVPDGAPSAQALGEASLLLLFAYAGFENTAAAAGEFRQPQRDVPFALLAMIAIVTLLYTLIQLVALGVVPDLAAHVGGAPLAVAATIVAGGWAASVMTAGAVVSMGGNLGATLFAAPRYLYALASDGFGPRVLGSVHPRFRTPAVAIVVLGLVALALALSGSFVQLVLLSTIARLATYVGTAAAVPVLRRKFPSTRHTIVLPGGAVIPAGALLLCLVFLASTTWRNLLAGAIALAVGAVIYFAGPRRPPEAPSTDAPGTR
jgi:amino acid transporter